MQDSGGGGIFDIYQNFNDFRLAIDFGFLPYISQFSFLSHFSLNLIVLHIRKCVAKLKKLYVIL